MGIEPILPVPQTGVHTITPTSPCSKYTMSDFMVKFRYCPEIVCRLDDTPLAQKYFDLVRQQYFHDPAPLFRDPQKYTHDYFAQLALQAYETLGWNWVRDRYTLDVTTQMHKDLEQYLKDGFESVPAEHDDLLHELHFALHAIESNSRRDNWLQIEWFNDLGFAIESTQYPAKVSLEFGDLRLQNPYVGHHPLFVYQQNDYRCVSQTCRFHDFVKPGINIVIDKCSVDYELNWPDYISWFLANGADFVNQHGIEKLRQFTGHPVVGRVVNLDDLETVVATPILELDCIEFA